LDATLEASIHELHLQDLRNPLHPSIYENGDNYNILILRLPELWESHTTFLSLRSNESWENKGRYHSYSFLLSETNVYQFDRNDNLFIPFNNGLDGMHLFLDQKIDKLLDDLNTAHDKIAFMEENFYKTNFSMPMIRWHQLKKEITKCERVITKALDVLGLFNHRYITHSHNLYHEFSDLYEHLERCLRAANSANVQLDDLYRYYNMRHNDRMNRSIYILTVVSVIFLPLNLAVGFFGMNTGGLPFHDQPMGTLYALEAMIIFAIILTLAVLWKIKKE